MWYMTKAWFILWIIWPHCTLHTTKLTVNLLRHKHQATNFNWKHMALIIFSTWYTRLCFLQIPTQYYLVSVPGRETNFCHQQCLSSEQLQVEGWISIRVKLEILACAPRYTLNLATCLSYSLMNSQNKSDLTFSYTSFIPDFAHLIEF